MDILFVSLSMWHVHCLDFIPVVLSILLCFAHSSVWCQYCYIYTSATVATVVNLIVGIYAVKNRLNMGPRTLPCGTTEFMASTSKYASWCLTWKGLSERYENNSWWNGWDKYVFSLQQNPSCQILSKAWPMSRKDANQNLLCSRSLLICFCQFDQ